MSGAYQGGNYEIFVPQSSKSKYQKYANQIVVIIALSRNKKGDVSAARILLTEAVDKLFGKNISFVKLGVSGSNVGIIPMEENDGECYAINRKEREGKETGMPFINIVAFAKYLNLDAGVYNAHKEPGNVIEFNFRSKPSRA